MTTIAKIPADLAGNPLAIPGRGIRAPEALWRITAALLRTGAAAYTFSHEWGISYKSEKAEIHLVEHAPAPWLEINESGECTTLRHMTRQEIRRVRYALTGWAYSSDDEVQPHLIMAEEAAPSLAPYRPQTDAVARYMAPAIGKHANNAPDFGAILKSYHGRGDLWIASSPDMLLTLQSAIDLERTLEIPMWRHIRHARYLPRGEEPDDVTFGEINPEYDPSASPAFNRRGGWSAGDLVLATKDETPAIRRCFSMSGAWLGLAKEPAS